MPDDKLSAKEAELIAQARAQLGKTAAATAPLARAERTPAAATNEPVAPGGATPVPAPDPAERIAALMAAARAETERLRRRQRQLYVWAPVAFMSAAGLWTLLWMWHRL